MTESSVPVQERPDEDVYAPSDSDLVEEEMVIKTHLDPMRVVSTPGIYLDDESRRAAEVTRARIEGREPDLENPPLYGGDSVAPLAEAAKHMPGDVVLTTVEPDFVQLVDKREFNDRGELVRDSEGNEVYAGEDIASDPTRETVTNEELATAQAKDDSQTGTKTDGQGNTGTNATQPGVSFS